MPQGQMIYNTIDRATPEAFGGQVGQTLQQAGNMLEQHAIQRQQLINETAAQDAYANQFSPAAREIYQNYMKLEGQDAEAQFPAFQQQMNDLRTQTPANLPNPMQQKAFDEMSTRRVEMDLDGMARYTAAQTKSWQWNTHTARIADLTAEAEANFNNPRRLQEVCDQVDNETVNYGSSHGWSPEVFRYQAGVNNDRLWGAVIRRQALSDLPAAFQTYQDQVSRGRISGAAQGEFEKFFKPIQDQQAAQNAYGKVTGGATAQQIATEAQRTGLDPRVALAVWGFEGHVMDPTVKNPMSSATGHFQAIDSTWKGLGGTDQDRFDSGRQIELGLQNVKQNTQVLAKDLHREPQSWEVCLAQLGIGNATALLHADPSANAAQTVEDSKVITLNGGTADMTVGQYLNFIKGYVDRRSQMYAANGTPTAQNLSENYDPHLQQLADQAQRDFPGDPTAAARYQSHYGQQAGRAIQGENITNRANWNIVNDAMTGPQAFQSKDEFLADPVTKAAYDAIYAKDRSVADTVDNVYYKKNLGLWNPPATEQTDQLYDNLNGMQHTDRERFANLNLMQYYGAMPVNQWNSLKADQDKILKNDAAQAAKHVSLSSSITAVKDLTSLAKLSPESPFYGLDSTSPFQPEKQKWNSFVSKYGQAIEDWRANNNGKIPTDMQKREIAQGILLPNPPSPPATVAPSFHGGADTPLPAEVPSKYEAALKSSGYPVTPANIKALYDQDQARGAK
jgi:hypothetical protein